MKKLNIFLIFVLALFSISAFYFNTLTVSAAENFGESINVVILGDSIAAGYAPAQGDLISEYTNYLNGVTDYTVGSYGDVFAERYEGKFTNINLVSHAVSGDKTQDLLDDLNNLAEVKLSVQNADAIVLCIGANNVLAPALDNLVNYLTGQITLSACEAQFQAGLTQFTQDYPTILQKLTLNGKAKVYPMTIFDPYKYADVNDITSTDSMLNMMKPTIATKFAELKTLAISYLDQVNTIIKNTQSQIVNPVDVRSEFDKLSKAEYPTYINVDLGNIVVNNYNELMGLQSHLNFDPHPTKLGHQKIGEIYKNTLNDIYIKADKTLTGKLDSFNLTYVLIGNASNYTISAYSVATSTTKLCQVTSATTTIDISSLNGEGYIYLVVEKQNDTIATSNQIAYNLDNVVSEPITAQVSISSNSSINNNSSVNDVTQVNLSYSLTTNSTSVLTLKIYKTINGVKQFVFSFNAITSGTTNVPSNYLVGSGYLTLECYSGTTLLASSNQLAFSFHNYYTTISCNTLSGDVNDLSQITLSYNTNISKVFAVSVYKQVGNQKIYISNIQQTNGGIIVQTEDLIGSGSVFIECYVDSITVTSNSLVYNFTNIVPEQKYVTISTNDALSGNPENIWNITLNLDHNISDMFTGYVYQKFNGTIKRLFSFTGNQVVVSSHNLSGQGTIYVILSTSSGNVTSNELAYDMTGLTVGPDVPQGPTVPPTQDSGNESMLSDYLNNDIIVYTILIVSASLVVAFAAYIIIKAIKRS